MTVRMMKDTSPDFKKGRSGSVFPEEVHTKKMASPTGAGKIMDYPDTEEDIHRDQEKGISEIHKKKMKPGYRY
jgi:hypothetical protein